MQDNVIDDMLKKVAAHAGITQATPQQTAKPQTSTENFQKPVTTSYAKPSFKKPVITKSGITVDDYPLSSKNADKIRGITGKRPEDITLKAVMDGDVSSSDIRISGDVLNMQADIAQAGGKRQFADSLRRAAEMTVIPDERVLEMYDMLRPNRATKKQLLDLASELENTYKAVLTAKFVRGAVDVYENRNILLK